MSVDLTKIPSKLNYSCENAVHTFKKDDGTIFFQTKMLSLKENFEAIIEKTGQLNAIDAPRQAQQLGLETATEAATSLQGQLEAIDPALNNKARPVSKYRIITILNSVYYSITALFYRITGRVNNLQNQIGTQLDRQTHCQQSIRELEANASRLNSEIEELKARHTLLSKNAVKIAGAFKKLHAEKKANAAVVKFQSAFRMHVAKTAFQKLQAEKKSKAAVKVQSMIRMYVAKTAFQKLQAEKKSKAAVKVQSILRMYAAKTAFQKLQAEKKSKAAVKLQSAFRMHVAKTAYKKQAALKQEAAQRRQVINTIGTLGGAATLAVIAKSDAFSRFGTITASTASKGSGQCISLHIDPSKVLAYLSQNAKSLSMPSLPTINTGRVLPIVLFAGTAAAGTAYIMQRQKAVTASSDEATASTSKVPVILAQGATAAVAATALVTKRQEIAGAASKTLDLVGRALRHVDVSKVGSTGLFAIAAGAACWWLSIRAEAANLQ